MIKMSFLLGIDLTFSERGIFLAVGTVDITNKLEDESSCALAWCAGIVDFLDIKSA
ncbi:hypothetical protein GCM10010869_05730 [Mesorhizobium tianshanense]|nr:hypothetical protein GCM10010869_05730 [Mesorhizobium tianshanense]